MKKYTILFIQLSTEINLFQNIEVDSPTSVGSGKRSSVKICFSRTKSNITVECIQMTFKITFNLAHTIYI